MLEKLKACVGKEVLVTNRVMDTQWDYGDPVTTESEFQYRMILRKVQPEGIQGELLEDLATVRKGSLFFHRFRVVTPEGPPGTNCSWQGPVDRQLVLIECEGGVVYEAL